ncbi:MAG: glutathione S-transferase family protein [Betaproteobacteria bacterium]|nr:glutathione S-transferase family protein [Betaproteobacteria bacterium]
MSALRLFGNPFSPFARKVRMVLEFKGLAFEFTDGLHEDNRAALEAVNPRREVPVLVEGATVIANSAHIVAYLEDAYPEPAVLPGAPAERARMRHWERVADTVLDPIVVDVSLWSWAHRTDEPPPGLREAAARDLASLYSALEGTLADGRAFLCGAMSIADIALFPNLYATRAMRLGADAKRFPFTAAWLRQLAALPVFAADLDRLRAWLKALDSSTGFERERIFWRGDRIEWLLANGFHRWFLEEIEQGRVLWPGTCARDAEAPPSPAP